MTTAYSHALTPRQNAVRRIADVLADRTAYVITLPPGGAELLAGGLSRIEDWTAYLDNGTSEVLATGSLRALRLAQLACPSAGVLTIPKTVDHRAVGRLVDQPVPADGSKDVIVLTGQPGQPSYWPVLFIDAVDLVDAVVAAQLRAHGTPAEV